MCHSVYLLCQEFVNAERAESRWSAWGYAIRPRRCHRMTTGRPITPVVVGGGGGGVTTVSW
jgi:hypothetical protein